jgi:hypothetical protein
VDEEGVLTLVGASPCGGSYRFTVTREWGGGVGGHDEEVEAKVELEDTPAMRCWLRRKEAVPGLRN